MTDLSNPQSHSPSRRWTIVAGSFLLVALALVVIYTSRKAFFSPLSLVVVAAIGLAALLLQLRLRRDKDTNRALQVPVRAPLWLNAMAIAFAVGTVLADVLHSGEGVLLAAALGAVICFGISGIVVLDALRKRRA